MRALDLILKSERKIIPIKVDDGLQQYALTLLREKQGVWSIIEAIEATILEDGILKEFSSRKKFFLVADEIKITSDDLFIPAGEPSTATYDQTIFNLRIQNGGHIDIDTKGKSLLQLICHS